MKASELRMGNTIDAAFSMALTGGNKEWRPITIDSTQKDSIVTSLGERIDFKEKYLRPTILTEERLLKFGFEYAMFSAPDDDGVFRDKKAPNKDYFKHPKLSDKIVLYLPYFDLNYYIGSLTIKYVHQLQNLYFALTREELKIKDIQEPLLLLPVVQLLNPRIGRYIRINRTTAKILEGSQKKPYKGIEIVTKLPMTE